MATVARQALDLVGVTDFFPNFQGSGQFGFRDLCCSYTALRSSSKSVVHYRRTSVGVIRCRSALRLDRTVLENTILIVNNPPAVRGAKRENRLNLLHGGADQRLQGVGQPTATSQPTDAGPGCPPDDAAMQFDHSSEGISL